MTDQNDDFTLNDPSRGITGNVSIVENPPKSFANVESIRTGGHRDGEVVIAVPEPEDVISRPLSESERQHYKTIDADAEQKRLAILASQITADTQEFLLPDGLRKIYMFGLVGIASVLSLLMLGQVTSALAQLSLLPVWSQWVIGTLLALVALVILYLVIKLMQLFFRLQKNEKINLTEIKALSDREALRKLAKEKSEEAVNNLKSYLENFPISEKEKLLGLGVTREEHAELLAAHTNLLEIRPEHETPNRWLAVYQASFQSVLDQIALRRAKAYAVKTALKTAISPLPLLDNTIVLALSLSMVRDMMTLYNLRMGVGGASQILLRAIGQAYIAGELQDISEGLAESLGDMIGEQTSQVAGAVAKMVGSKVAEGTANGLMIYRLGKATSKLLQASG